VRLPKLRRKSFSRYFNTQANFLGALGEIARKNNDNKDIAVPSGGITSGEGGNNHDRGMFLFSLFLSRDLVNGESMQSIERQIIAKYLSDSSIEHTVDLKISVKTS